MTAIQPATLGVHHVGITVPDLDTTRDFFTDELGFSVLGGVEDYPSAFVSDGHTMITLWQAKTSEPRAFNRHENLGLHHLAFKVVSVGALSDLHTRLAAKVEVEFAPQPLGSGPAQHMMCTIPGGIRVEFFAAQ